MVMSEATEILRAVERGDRGAAGQLLPLVYDELRRLAAQRLAHEPAGQTLDATALVHEAYLRLVGDHDAARWDSRGHFFAAAAEAMRRILVESARRKSRHKHGGGRKRVELAEDQLIAAAEPDRVLALDEALLRLANEDAIAAQVVQLHFFAGISLEQVAQIQEVSYATVKRHWAYARAWLRCAMRSADGPAAS
jgi:RNA polymerase sigma factor (TIGR02999 family)